jgi:hypothetical protein
MLIGVLDRSTQEVIDVYAAGEQVYESLDNLLQSTNEYLPSTMLLEFVAQSGCCSEMGDQVMLFHLTEEAAENIDLLDGPAQDFFRWLSKLAYDWQECYMVFLPTSDMIGELCE